MNYWMHLNGINMIKKASLNAHFNIITKINGF